MAIRIYGIRETPILTKKTKESQRDNTKNQTADRRYAGYNV